jgi:hypothetical protein
VASRWQFVAVVAFGSVLAACSTSSPKPQVRATAEACGVFSGHAETKQLQMAASEGQRSGDAKLALEARQLGEDMAQPDEATSALVAMHNMAGRCGELGFRIAPGW